MTVADIGNLLSCIALMYTFSCFMMAMKKEDMSSDFQSIADMMTHITCDVADDPNLSAYMKEKLGDSLSKVTQLAETNSAKWQDGDKWAKYGLIAIVVTMFLYCGSHILQDQMNSAHDEGFHRGRNEAYDEMLMEGIPVKARKELLEDKK